MNCKAFGALAVLVCAATGVVACGAAAPPVAQTVPGAVLTRAERLAVAFAQAADAERGDDRAALALAVQTIEASSAHPLEQTAEDPMPTWQAKAGPTATPAFRGRPLGPGYRSGRLSGGGKESFSQLFLSGTGATIALSAPTGDKLGLRVIDPQARPICIGSAVRGNLCRWVPLFTQRYTIEVTNLGDGDARYFLVVE